MGTDATFIKCDKGFSHVSLQFATKDDIKAMSSDGAKLINAAAENGKSNNSYSLYRSVHLLSLSSTCFIFECF